MKGLDDMLLFAQLVKLKSFRAVAAERQIASSVVSKHISRLEERLGIQLLIRTTRRLNLTEAGQEFFTHCLQVESDVAMAEQAVSVHVKHPKGTLRITAPMISGQYFLPTVIQKYLNQFQDMEVDMVLRDDFQDLVSDNIDLAIRTGTLTDSTLRARKLINSRWRAYAAPRYLEKFGVPRKISELTKHNCLQYTHQETGPKGWPITINGFDQCVAVSGNFKANSLISLCESAKLGIGIAFLPTFLVSSTVAPNELVPVLEKSLFRDVGIYAVYPNVRFVPRKTSTFIDTLAASYQSNAEKFN